MPKKLKILIYRDQLMPFSDTFILDQSEALKNFIPYYCGSKRVPGLSLPNERVISINKQGTWIENNFEKAFKFLQIPIHTQKLKQLQPALIHAHFGPDAIYALPYARILGIPLVTTFHGYGILTEDTYAQQSSFSQRQFIRKRDILIIKGSLFIAVSEFIKKKLITLNFPANKIIVHHNGVDLTKFKADPKINRERIVLFVGRLEEKKGCEYLIKSMRLVQNLHPEIKLVIVGDGKLRFKLENMAANLISNFEFTGSLNHDEVKTWMNKAELLCVPSIQAKSGDAESFGIVFAEAQAMKLPQISFATGGIPEVIIHEKTGFLVDEGDWKELANKILILINSTKLRNEFGIFGLEQTKEKFNLEIQTKKLEEIYFNLL